MLVGHEVACILFFFNKLVVESQHYWQERMIESPALRLDSTDATPYSIECEE